MIGKYSAFYSDVHGKIPAIIENDGENLKLLVDGAEFTGSDFDLLEPVGSVSSTRFVLNSGTLSSFSLEFLMPIKVIIDGKTCEGDLEILFNIDDKQESVKICLIVSGNRFSSNGLSGLFETELDQLKEKLPSGWFLKICYGCAYSDYSVYGQGLFGNMICFRTKKLEYLEIKNKHSFRLLSGTVSDRVQETYLCDEFEIRKPGTGYRG